MLALLLALWATTLNALSPLIASAKPVSIAQDICSANGPQRHTKDETSGDVPDNSQGLSRCALCLVPAQSVPASVDWNTGIARPWTGQSARS